MKRKIFIASKIFSLCMFMWIEGNSQFTTAVENDLQVSSGSVQVQNTGNDILICPSTNDNLLVTVWDSGNGVPGIGFDDFNGHSGILPLNQADAYDPDVAIISDGVIEYAVVAYYDLSGNDFIVEFYEWNGATLIYFYNDIIMNNVPFGTAINVDGNLYGDFAVVFDVDSLGNKLGKCITGFMNSGAPFFNFAAPITITNYLGVQPIAFPDVCLWDSAGTELMYVSYLNGSGDIAIQVERWPNINNSSPIINYTLYASVAPSGLVTESPRIACGANMYDRDIVTVVWSVYNAGSPDTWDIEYLNFNSSNPGIPNSGILTDGSNSPNTLPVINEAENRYPVVAYTDQDLVFIGWTYDNYSPFYGSGFHPGDKLPIGVRCNQDMTLSYNDFWDVPKGVYGKQETLSLSGKKNHYYMGLSWYDDSGSGTRAVYHKGANPSSSFRSAFSNSQSELNNLKQIEILDLQGKILMNLNNEDDIENWIRNSNLHQGIYLINKIYDNGKESKLFHKI